MEILYKKDGTPVKLMTDEDMKAINLVPLLNTSDWYDIHTAYCASRIVYITLLIKSGIDFQTKSSQLINNKKYYPNDEAYGFVNIHSSKTDFGKILNTSLNSSGEINIWMSSALAYGELVTFIYPLKS